MWLGDIGAHFRETCHSIACELFFILLCNLNGFFGIIKISRLDLLYMTEPQNCTFWNIKCFM